MKDLSNEKFSLIGTRAPRIDGVEKLTGRAEYGCDISFPGMLHAKVLFSDVPHANIKSINIEAAESLPGVEAVICYKNVPRVPHTTCGTPIDTAPLDTYIFDTKVRYYGEPVAAVAAISEEVAIRAIDLIEVEYDELDAVFDPRQALEPGAPVIHDNKPDNLIDAFKIDLGNVDEGFALAEHLFEDDYFIPIIQHCTLDTHGCVVKPDAGDRITVWSSTQVPYPLHRILAKAIDLPEENITVNMPAVGGGFGAKQEVVVEPICALLALRAQKPVRLYFTREEDIVSSRTRHSLYAKLKTGVDNEGFIIAREAVLHVNSGAYCSHGMAIPYIAGTSWAHVYNTPSIRFTGNLVYTNSQIGGAYRGFGDPQMFFANENHFDRIAKELHIDPVEFRLKNTIKSGDIDRVNNWDLTDIGLDECIRKGAELFEWDEKRQKARDQGDYYYGTGMATFSYSSSSIPPGGPDSTAATVRLNSNGTVTLMTASVDIGQGCTTAFAQIVAEELGLDYADVRLDSISTDTSPYDVGTYGTRQIYIGGRAVQGAARAAKEKIDKIASRLLGGEINQLKYGKSRVWLDSKPEQKITMKDIAHEAFYGAAPVHVVGNFIWNSAGIGPTYGAHYVELRVDKLTGKVTVDKAFCVHDAGQIINLSGAEGQVEGGFVQGLSIALFEEMKRHPKTGETLNTTLNKYLLATSADMPDIKTHFVVTHAEKGVYGARGIGEPAFIPATAAVTNAVCNAIDTQICSLPYTPDKVYEAMRCSGERT